MATIKVLNASQVNPESPVEIKLGIVNEPDKPIQYVGIPGPEGKPGKDGKQGPQGPKGDTPIKGVDYFTSQDIADIAAQVPVPEVDLTDYASKSFVETAIRGAETGLLKRSVVEELPVSNIDDNTIYMVPKTGSLNDVYNEYLYIDNNWEHIGSTDVDLTDYATKNYVNTAIVNGSKAEYIIKIKPQYVGSRTVDITEFPDEIKNKLWAWWSSLVNKPTSGINYIEYTNAGFNIFISYSGKVEKVDAICVQPHYITGAWQIYFLSLAPRSENIYLNTVSISSPYTLLQMAMPDDNTNWATTGVEGPSYPIKWGIDARHVIAVYGTTNYNGKKYTTVDSILSVKQNLLTAGTGITLSGSTISVNTQYLTNSDILAIWNGENN